MLIRRLTRACILPTLLFATAARAQDAACAGGPADEGGMQAVVTMHGTPEHAAARVSAGLAALGYTASQPPHTRGPWTAAPSHSWVPEYLAGMANGQAHPGVQLSGDIQPRGDSVEVTIAARTLCRLASAGPAGPLGSVEDMLEQFSAYFLVDGLVAPDAERRVGPFSLNLPDQLADLRLMQRRPTPPRAIVLHYAGADSLMADVFFYLGPVPFVRCTPSCHEVGVRREISGYLSVLPQMRIAAGAAVELEGMEALPPGPGNGWVAGGHVTHHLVRGESTLATHYYVYAFPDFFMKVRSTFPANPQREQRLQTFVDAAVAAIIRREGERPPPALPGTR